jgi:hypothetical protein
MFVMPSRRPRFTEEQLREAIAASVSWADTLRRLEYRSAGGNWKTLKKYAELWSVSTAHFDPDAVRLRAFRNPPTPLEQILVEDSTYSRNHLKDRLYSAGLKQRRCELCGQREMWRGRRMALILDHVNGVPNDNRIENLRILCPNCAATLETHCGLKNRKQRMPRQCLLCGLDFFPNYRRQRYCSRECGSRWDRSGILRRVPRFKSRRVVRPPYEQLLREIGETSYAAIGRKYGVSDNAIRKWVRFYEREHQAMQPGDQKAL